MKIFPRGFVVAPTMLTEMLLSVLQTIDADELLDMIVVGFTLGISAWT
jgi:hypothetical protein